MRILVCGGREYKNVGAVQHALGTVHKKYGITLIIEGGMTGADTLAREWAIANDVPFKTVEANWRRYGKAGGPIRNSIMLREWKPDAVVAFPGNNGTDNMITQAERAGVPVWKPFR